MYTNYVIHFLACILVSFMTNSRATSDPTSFREPNNLNDEKNVIDLINIPLGTPDSENEIPGEPLNPQDFHNALTVSMDIPPRDKFGGDPIHMAGLFEGDIAGVNPNDVAQGRSRPMVKNAIIDMSLRWPDGVIPYVISALFSQYDRSVIARAMLEYHNKTCLRFVPRTNQRDYIHIMSGSGCSSNVGRTGGAQPVSLGNGCVYVGIVIHEFMHATGFWHEQSRNDRDDFITINWGNIVEGMQYNFQKYSLDRIQYLDAPYDTGSVMHYDSYAFAKDRQYPTILAKKPGTELGQRRGFSQVDILKINRLYNCNGGNTGTAVGTTTIAPLVSTELPGKCEDGNKYCTIWSKRGECQSNAVWMNVHCRKSCQQCNVDCGNFNVFCDQWAKRGECKKNAEYMNIYCPKACEHCGSVSGSGCIDENRYCSAWANRGQCTSNPEYMLLRCKKSCKKC